MKPLSANPTKWTKTLTQFVSKLPTNCLSVFGHFVNLALKGLTAFFVNGQFPRFSEELPENLWKLYVHRKGS